VAVHSKPTAIVVGGVGKLPYGGLSFHYLHHVDGLRQLGYEVHYVERQNRPGECYDPRFGTMTDDPTFAVGYLERVLPTFGVGGDRWSFVDLRENCHGSGWKTLRSRLDRADFVLTIANPTWFDELERCHRRAYVDGDPLFTQVAMATGSGPRADAPSRYDVLFTYGTRIGKPDCAIPDTGRQWLPARPVVSTSRWGSEPPPDRRRITALLHWAAGGEVSMNGRSYGHKDREFEPLLDLPTRTGRELVLAVGGRNTPRDRLREHGWRLEDPLVASETPEAYQRFIAGSAAELGIAKHAYVASRSGWFSDRSACYLAAGRPVLHQDTGCGDWLPTGEGVLLFSDADDVVEALGELDADYERHARTARRLAEEYFEARDVLSGMLDAAGFR
jgi:hypothetical protein